MRKLRSVGRLIRWWKDLVATLVPNTTGNCPLGSEDIRRIHRMGGDGQDDSRESNSEGISKLFQHKIVEERLVNMSVFDR